MTSVSSETSSGAAHVKMSHVGRSRSESLKGLQRRGKSLSRDCCINRTSREERKGGAHVGYLFFFLKSEVNLLS